MFDHKDVRHADSLVAEARGEGHRTLLITDGVFSMDGDIAPVGELVEVAERHGAIFMIDDAHASGRPGAPAARAPRRTSAWSPTAWTSRWGPSRRRSG